MLRPMPDLMPETAPTLCAHISVSGHKMRPLAAGALYWEEEDTLLVADLHLEKGAAYAALGMLLPPYDTRTTLERLSKVIRAVDPSRVVALGDSFHRSDSANRLAPEDLKFLLKLQQGREWYWICGNHDPHLPASIGGTVCATLTICGVTLRHEPSAAQSAREIAGHLHPVARIARRGAVIRRRCFAADGNRLVMPAFGAYAGGLNVLDEAFGPLFLRHQLEAWMMGRADVYPVLGSLLLPD
ncbi:MAG: ligase-associated DNA damage response endonuclease PdeM [Methyloceanibacter sp.]